MAEPFTEPTTARCRHCARTLSKITAGWVDENGMFACVKAPEQVPGAPLALPVLHEPIPAPLEGSPR